MSIAVRRLTTIVGVVLLSGLLLPCFAELRIQNVSTDRTGFRSDAGEQVTVRFRLAAAARVELKIYDSRDLLIRTIHSEGLLDAGDAALAWDGRSDQGEPVPPEAYFYTLVARSADGEEVVYDVSDLSRGEDEELPELSYDPERNTVTYVLPGPSRVSLRAGLGEGGALLSTLVNWEPRVEVAGRESVELNLKGVASEALVIHGQYFRFPRNVIVVQPSPGKTYERRFVTGATERRTRERRASHMYRHADHTRDQCYDFGVSLELVGGVREHREGVPVIEGGAALRIDIPPEDRRFAENQRFETVFYLDGVFVTELEQGYVPFRWPLDSISIPPSEHVLTVNLRGYEGHFGCASIRFIKEVGSRTAGSPASNQGAENSVDDPVSAE